VLHSGANVIKLFQIKKEMFVLIRSKSYKTYFFFNLQTFMISQSVFPFMPFQPSLMFVSKAETYPSEVPFRCSILGSAPDLNH
jgi:hypothetical protein